MKRILIAIVLIFSLLLIPSTANIASADESDNTSYEFGNVTLEVEVVPPKPAPAPAPPTGDGAPAAYSVKTDIFGKVKTFYTNYKGEVQKTIEATSKDGLLTFTIPKKTTALGEDGKRLKGLEAAVDESPPDPPEDAHIIGLAYDFGPDGATFEPPITFTWSYDHYILPTGIVEKDLVLAYHDGEAWIELEC
ncbi:unnamed protein product, partial [marine sediment metagenome]